MTSNNAASARLAAAVLSDVGMSPLVTNRKAGYGSSGSFSMFFENTSVCIYPGRQCHRALASVVALKSRAREKVSSLSAWQTTPAHIKECGRMREET